MNMESELLRGAEQFNPSNYPDPAENLLDVAILQAEYQKQIQKDEEL